MKEFMNTLFIIFLVCVFLIGGISAIVIHWLNKSTRELKAELPPAKNERPSILYLIQEGFIVIESYEQENHAPAWYIQRFGNQVHLFVDKQAGQPFMIGYSDDPKSIIVVPDKYVNHVKLD